MPKKKQKKIVNNSKKQQQEKEETTGRSKRKVLKCKNIYMKKKTTESEDNSKTKNK